MTPLQPIPPDLEQRQASYRAALEQHYDAGAADDANGELEQQRQRLGLSREDALRIEVTLLRGQVGLLKERLAEAGDRPSPPEQEPPPATLAAQPPADPLSPGRRQMLHTRAQIAVLLERWLDAQALYRELDGHGTQSEEAELVARHLAEIEVQRQQQLRVWDEKQAALEQLVAHEPDSKVYTQKLAEVRREQELDQLAALALTLVAQDAWDLITGVLGRINQLNPSYQHPLLHIRELDQHVQTEQALRTAFSWTEQREWHTAQKILADIPLTDPLLTAFKQHVDSYIQRIDNIFVKAYLEIDRHRWDDATVILQQIQKESPNHPEFQKIEQKPIIRDRIDLIERCYKYNIDPPLDTDQFNKFIRFLFKTGHLSPQLTTKHAEYFNVL